MPTLDTLDLKAFVPARDFERSRRFYEALGFTCTWASPDLACFEAGRTAFLLENDYLAIVAENFSLHLLVADVDAWWQRAHDARLADIYGVTLTRPQDRPWGMREFRLTDPSGVTWRIAQPLGTPGPAHGAG
ncbi:VOC family protein [Denitromonas iodatirespirans]|uniref:VOC family protein n=1 Tax=Denitromonas iodatirespirans TaxID=2795389 RepID=A0A944HA34_DENI1|nr:VOC family protein [Denitromonas iodatirespirans]MBT0963070.1 VOC family protein [Denitromonas iodatirespirans]